MPKLPRVKPQKVLSALLRAGFYAHHQSGSHINLRHKVKTYLHVILRSSLNPVFYCDFTGLAANNSEFVEIVVTIPPHSSLFSLKPVNSRYESGFRDDLNT